MSSEWPTVLALVALVLLSGTAAGAGGGFAADAEADSAAAIPVPPTVGPPLDGGSGVDGTNVTLGPDRSDGPTLDDFDVYRWVEQRSDEDDTRDRPAPSPSPSESLDDLISDALGPSNPLSPTETETEVPTETETATPEPTRTEPPAETETPTPESTTSEPSPEPTTETSTTTPTETETPTSTPTEAPTPTPSPTETSTPTETPTPTPSPTEAPTPTSTPTEAPTPTQTPTETPTPTPTPTETPESDPAGLDTATVERLVHEYINDERTARGLDSLSFDADLREIARSHSTDMATRDYFSHTDPEGDNFADRYEAHGYECRAPTGDGTYLTGGENIALTWYDTPVQTDDGVVRYTSEEELARGIVDQWMGSQGHRENLLNEHWNNEGIGIHVTEENKVYATQNFC